MTHDFRYRFGADGHIRTRSGETWSPTAWVALDGVCTSTWLGAFEPSERDLLRVTAAALEADRLSPRRPEAGSRLVRDMHWQRSLHLEIAVESPERWRPAIPLLQDLLCFMTDDLWELEFVRLSYVHQQQVALPQTRLEQVTEVALFSGGLDSAAGVLARHRADPRSHFLAVSACGNGVRGAAQQVALQKLRALGVSASWLKMDHQLRGAHRPRSRMEASQRSRGLLFLAMGAAATSLLRLSGFSVYETGVGCINLPTSGAQIGAQGTRAMHPRTLALFNRLVERVLDRAVTVQAPYFLHTKGALCSLAGSDLSALASVTMSCDEGEGHKPASMLHCGLCTSCLFRRIALHAAGLGADPTCYRDIATRKHDAYELIAFENHAVMLRACASFDDLVALDPDVHYAQVLPLAAQEMNESPAKAVLAMFHRYAAEMQAYLANARPTISPRARPLGKEGALDLFAAAG